MLTLWGRKTSVNVQKPMWLLAELGVPYERIDAGGPFGRLDEPGFRAISPAGLVPALVDERDGGRTTLFESPAILRYLASVEGADALWPSDPRDRARIDAWAEWTQAALYPPFLAVFSGVIRSPAADRDLSALRAAHALLTQRLALAESAVAQCGWLAADRMTLADILLGAATHRLFTLEISRPSLPALEDYYARLKTRPAFADVVAVDYDGMRVPGAERVGAPVV